MRREIGASHFSYIVPSKIIGSQGDVVVSTAPNQEVIENMMNLPCFLKRSSPLDANIEVYAEQMPPPW